MISFTFSPAAFTRLLWPLLVTILSACQSPAENHGQMATLTVSIPGYGNETLAAGKPRPNVAQRNGVPAEISSLLIEVLNDANEVLDSAEIIGTEGTVNLSVEAGNNYTIRGRGFAGTELLFLGQAQVSAVIAGSTTPVSLTLLEQVQLNLGALPDLVPGSAQLPITFNLAGLQNRSINWYINGIIGGNAEFGRIDANGVYTPPALLPGNPLIEVTAEPVIAPSFAQSFTFSLLPAPVNAIPVANAGTDQVVAESTAVTLDASPSSDSDGTIASFSWSLLAGPAITLIDAATATPRFTAPVVTASQQLLFELTVTDDDGASSSDQVLVTVNPINLTPQANAGVDQTVNEQTPVTLTGAASTDADGSIAAYQWNQLSGPGVTLSSASAQSPTFTAPTLTTAATLVFELTVTDNENASGNDTVAITVNPVNIHPLANAGADQTVNALALVNLSAAASSDADGTIAGYRWIQVSNGLEPVLNNPQTPTPTFTAPAAQFGGSVTYRLTVTDNEGATAIDEVTININGTDQPLVANAGPDQVVNEATLVTLDAAASNDPDDAIIAYLWEELSNGGIVINATTSPVATFTAPNVNDATVFQFRLTVTNDNNEQAIDTITVTVNNVVTVASDVFFAATTDGFNYNLWASDGTDAGTRQLAAVSLQNQDLHEFKTIGDFFYFVGNDGINGNELWRSDGATTEMIISAPDSAFPGLGASASVNPTALSVLGERLLYEANTSYDGTFLFPEYLSLNTVDDSLQTVFAGNIASFEPVEVGVAAGFSYFYVNNFSPSVTTDLYRSDGIGPATLVSSFTGFFRLHDFTEVNGEMFFVVGNNQLWKTDGSGPGTVQIKLFSGPVGHSNSFTGENNTIVFNGELYFVADDGQGRELWKSNGSEAGTVLVADLDQAATSTNPTEFRIVNGVLTFLSSAGGPATDGLWTSDGTPQGTLRLAALSVNDDVGFYAGADTGVARVVETLGLLFFTADNGVGGSELWVSDGSTSGTRPVREINPLGSAFPALFIAGDGFLLFSAQDADFRAKLWRSDGSETGTVIIRDILPSGFDNQAFFQLGD